MAQVLVTPTLSVSPAGGGTCSYALGTAGSYSYPAIIGAWRNYIYTATPAPGFRFVRFEVTVTQLSSDVSPVTVTNRYTDNPYHADNGENQWLDGSAWWSDIISYPQLSKWVDQISVVAVFEKRNSGQLVYSANQNGQLVYSAYQGDALVYDG